VSTTARPSGVHAAASAAAPVERPLFFASGAHRLFGVLHEAPAGKSAFVFCHAFAEEKLWAHRVLVSFARRLASDGHAVLRFDCAGSGDSEGRTEETSFRSMIDDTRAAIATVRELTGADGIGLLGLRLGGTIAALAAEETPETRQLVLWAPIVDGGRYMQELLRANLSTQLAAYREIRWDRAALTARLQAGETVNVDGYEMAWPLFEQCSAVALGRTPMRYHGPCLVAQTTSPFPDKALEACAAEYAQGTLVHAPEHPFWKEIPTFYGSAPQLDAATLAWLRAVIGAGRHHP
jgi:exosortase A-associated hydrolase 2